MASLHQCVHRSAMAREFTWCIHTHQCVHRSAVAREFTWCIHTQLCVHRSAVAREFTCCIHTHQCVFIEVQWLESSHGVYILDGWFAATFIQTK